MFETPLKALGAEGLVVGLVTRLGTIVGWIASDSFGDTLITALWIAGPEPDRVPLPGSREKIVSRAKNRSPASKCEGWRT
jgi:hypothetical protein